MLVFRADGNQKIGSGHIMRCISIADEAVLHGQECLFITAGDEFSNTIIAHGHKNQILNTEYNHMEQEANQLFSILEEAEKSNGLEAVLVDSYQVTVQYLNKLLEFCKAKGAKLVYIDDILSFAYPCDFLVNYNIYGPDCDYASLYQGAKSPALLLGTSYAPLRAEFQHLPARIVREKGRVIFISTGGADFEHVSIQILREILSRGEAFHDYDFHFIMGKADVAISAAGSTLYELCATNTPTVTYILADNQIPGAEGFSRHGALKNIGDVRKLGVRALSGLLVDSAVELCNDYESRKLIALKMSAVVDGLGAKRIVEAIL